jgi:hypothetical protein
VRIEEGPGVSSGYRRHRGFRGKEIRDLSSLEIPRRNPSRGSQGGHVSKIRE